MKAMMIGGRTSCTTGALGMSRYSSQRCSDGERLVKATRAIISVTTVVTAIDTGQSQSSERFPARNAPAPSPRKALMSTTLGK
jgi:hypothetical protein